MIWLVPVPLLLPALLLPLARLATRSGRPERASRALAVAALVTAASGVACLVLVAATLADDLPAAVANSRRAHARGHILPEPIPDAFAVAVTLLLAWIAWRLAAELGRRRAIARDLHAVGPARERLLVVEWASPRAVAVPPRRDRPGHVLVTRGLLRLLDARERAAVLAHEGAHLSRRHHRTTALAGAAAALNPLLHPVVSAVWLLVERSADEDAARAVADRRLVAHTVAKVALAAHGQAAALGFGGSSTLRRVEALTRPQPGRRPAGAVDASAVLLAALSLALVAAACIDFVELFRVWVPRY
ncbi:M48 family metalloprotease [Dactylosporangium darangshiense]|uniref:Peptidase M48 domain-containing protein n=1 Tax=Dactylosporangium darangshiense TaxID=579108 RepID=A0ABP8DUL1_9ACTN